MDASDALSVSWAFIVRLVEGIPQGDPLSLALLAALFLGVSRFMLTRWAWLTTKSLTLIALFGYYMYLVSNVVADEFGHDMSLYLRGAAAALCGVFVFHAGKRVLAETRGGGHVSRRELASKPNMRPMMAHVGGGYSYAGGGSHSPMTRMVRHARKGAANAGSGMMSFFGQSHEQRLPSVLALMFIAEFGVFSTGLVAPPKGAVVGMVFFGLLLAGAVAYILATYERKGRGVVNFLITSVAAVAVALVFDVFWAATPMSTALSLEHFFTSAPIIAAATGIGFSLVIQGHG